MAPQIDEAKPGSGQSNDDGESKKSSERILRHELAEAHHALGRSTHRLLVSGFAAGLELGFSVFLMAVVLSMSEGVLSQPVLELLIATMYSFGFIIVVIGRSELFTEQTSLAILPLLSGETTLRQVARLWVLVYVSNLVGGAAIALFIVKFGPALGVIVEPTFERIASQMADHVWWVIFLSGILAGWLMGLLSWLVAAGRDTISQIVIVWLITAAIGLGHLHHTVVGTIEVLAGVFAGSGTTGGDFGRFLLWTTLGNAVGGSFFVALLKYGISRPGRHQVGPHNQSRSEEQAVPARRVTAQSATMK